MAESGDLSDVTRKVPLSLSRLHSPLWKLHSQEATEWQVVTSGSQHAPFWFRSPRSKSLAFSFQRYGTTQAWFSLVHTGQEPNPEPIIVEQEIRALAGQELGILQPELWMAGVSLELKEWKTGLLSEKVWDIFQRGLWQAKKGCS